MAFLCALSACSAAEHPPESASAEQRGKSSDLQKTWELCQEDTQCVAIRGVCQVWVGVNRDSIESASNYYQKMNRLARCVPRTELAIPDVRCVAERCKTIN